MVGIWPFTMKVVIAIVLLAAAAGAEVFRFVSPNVQGSSLLDVRGAITVGALQLTRVKTALEYNGTLAIEKTGEGEYLAKFTQFTLDKYDRIDRTVQDATFDDLSPEERRAAKVVHEQGAYEAEMKKPIKFSMKWGKVLRMEASQAHQQWSLNIYRAILTLLQNGVKQPANLAVPFIDYSYEDGITGHCKVQYEIVSQPENQLASGVYNMSKTYNYKQCLGRPVYMHLKDVHRGCAGVCDNHFPDNLLSRYEEEHTDYEMKPTPGCPVNQQRKDSLVTVQTISKYNVSNGVLDEARSESLDVLHLFGGRMQVFTRLWLGLRGDQGPNIEQPSNTKVYETLQQRLPMLEEDELAIPVYALMREHSKGQEYPEFFQKHFDAVIRELHQLHGNQKQGQQNVQQGFDATAYIVELIQAISGMTEEEIRKTMPNAVRQQQPKQMSEEDQLRRQIWIELLGKAGSKTAVKIAIELIKNKTFTASETRHILQDIASFQSYPDTEMIEQVLGLCIQGQGLTSTGKTTACVAAGKVISKACDSKVNQKSQKEQRQWNGQSGKHWSLYHGPSRQGPWKFDAGAEKYETTMGHLAIKPQFRCTPDKLQEYVQRLTRALRQATEFKQIVAYLNGMAKIEKPEALVELIDFVEGKAPNMQQMHEPGEDQWEAINFVRRVAILSLRNVAAKYPKEVNPIVRVIYENTTEPVQTRILAFDVWMNTQPAQWEVEKVMQVANKDTSLELTHYVYTALKTAMNAKEPCYQLL
ncbi:vitellogenin 1-like [Tropilaelaps mercedesae]|uniref:Vitellogenin 1-like n=1 Tax=Tropilaelaps mercedesae TaxID=418985 RepID=A0A1V9Y1X3_9ACAR|nr:vitellogenin 1-like [Tropilaelaps mercedesae]